MDNKKICENCGIEKNENQYYRSRICDNSTMDVCKECFKNEINDSKDVLLILRKYDIPFLADVWHSVYEIGEYMKIINSLPQYSRLQWKDSIMGISEQKEELNFYDGIVKNLKKEAETLNKKLTAISNNHGDYNVYIAILKSLRETLELISKYDWRLNYSEYTTSINESISEEGLNKGKSGKEVRQVAVWEQNHDNQIRNHKIWTVVSDNIKIDDIGNVEMIAESVCKKIKEQLDMSGINRA